ncbi:MAG: zinc ribbon domain-containing protein [Prevotella sp.]|nr:zinc ribbon domain-containing protein [Prevotella sp.]
MMDEITQRPAGRQLEMGPVEKVPDEQQPKQMMQQAQMANGVVCPKCGTMNDQEARFCASCGELLRMGNCPNCGSELDPEADFCEVCHQYVRPDLCSFCGAHVNPNDSFCPECGSPRGGIVCPTCHTLNSFSFCKKCGQPLTEDAYRMMEQLQEQPEYKELVMIAREYNDLSMQLPFSSDDDMRNDEASLRLRETVLRLLAQDIGVENPMIPQVKSHRLTKEQLEARKREKLAKLSQVLEKMAIPPTTSPATVRNYAMAQKPMGVRLAWRCNYKNALHSSPCGCAKPQMGGQWIVLGQNSKQDIKDDK